MNHLANLAEILCGTSELFKGAIIVCKKNHQGYTEELSLAFGPLVYLFILMLVFISFIIIKIISNFA